jgi:hypothetical protein
MDMPGLLWPQTNQLDDRDAVVIGLRRVTRSRHCPSIRLARLCMPCRYETTIDDPLRYSFDLQ